MKHREALLFCVLGVLSAVYALDNGLARTPPMGWLVWGRFRCNTNCEDDPDNCINEKLFMEMADQIVKQGFKELGYEHVNIDDCWAAPQRDIYGRLQADPDRFPHGIKYLADYMHSRGLKLGIYSDYGAETCEGYLGSGGHFEEDARTFAEWGVDMLKLDGCHSPITEMPLGYTLVERALNRTGRPMIFSCSWPAYWTGRNEAVDYAVVADTCNLWRNYNDIQTTWDSVVSIINYYSANQNDFQPYSGPGHWNDPDMIIIGNDWLTEDQEKAQMAMWSMIAAPLLMSNDLRNISKESVKILKNRELIAVNQDPMGIQGQLIDIVNNTRIYTRPLIHEEMAVVFFHNDPDEGPVTITISGESLGLKDDFFDVRDLFEQSSLGTFYKELMITVPPVGVVMLKISAYDSRSL